MANQTGIAIVIKAFLPVGKNLDDQYEALSLVKKCHASGDYSELLKAAMVDEVKTEMKTRRVDEDAQASSPVEPQPAAEETRLDDWANPPAEEDKPKRRR